jgi:hypothetical protein
VLRHLHTGLEVLRIKNPGGKIVAGV